MYKHPIIFYNIIIKYIRDKNLITEDKFIHNIKNLYFAYSCTLEDELPYEVIKELEIQCRECGNIVKITQDLINLNLKKCNFKYKCNKIFDIAGFEF